MRVSWTGPAHESSSVAEQNSVSRRRIARSSWQPSRDATAPVHSANSGGAPHLFAWPFHPLPSRPVNHRATSRPGITAREHADVSNTYIHGTDPEEQARLTRLNQLLNQRSVEEIALCGGERILDLGSGLGQLSRALARAA